MHLVIEGHSSGAMKRCPPGVSLHGQLENDI